MSSAVSTVAVHAEARSGGWGTGFPYSRPLVKSCKNPTFWPIYCILNLYVRTYICTQNKKFTAFLFALKSKSSAFTQANLEEVEGSATVVTTVASSASYSASS